MNQQPHDGQFESDAAATSRYTAPVKKRFESQSSEAPSSLYIAPANGSRSSGDVFVTRGFSGRRGGRSRVVFFLLAALVVVAAVAALIWLSLFIYRSATVGGLREAAAGTLNYS